MGQGCEQMKLLSSPISCLLFVPWPAPTLGSTQSCCLESLSGLSLGVPGLCPSSYLAIVASAFSSSHSLIVPLTLILRPLRAPTDILPFFLGWVFPASSPRCPPGTACGSDAGGLTGCPGSCSHASGVTQHLSVPRACHSPSGSEQEPRVSAGTGGPSPGLLVLLWCLIFSDFPWHPSSV